MLGSFSGAAIDSQDTHLNVSASSPLSYWLCIFKPRNWRLLWASLPRERRKQVLLDMMRGSPGSFRFAGIRVCSRAFQILSGISAGSIQEIREKVSKGVIAIWRESSLAWMAIKNQSKAHRYIDSRNWIESYAETHGEKSPMDGKPADLSTFRRAWSNELPWIRIANSESWFNRFPKSLPREIDVSHACHGTFLLCS